MNLTDDLIQFGYEHFAHLLRESMTQGRRTMVEELTEAVKKLMKLDLKNYSRRPQDYVKVRAIQRGIGLTTWALISAFWLRAKIDEFEKEANSVEIHFTSQIPITQVDCMCGNAFSASKLRYWYINGFFRCFTQDRPREAPRDRFSRIIHIEDTYEKDFTYRGGVCRLINISQPEYSYFPKSDEFWNTHTA